MGRSPCCAKEGLNRGTWTASEDKILSDYIKIHGEGKWRSLPKRAGLKRCGKSCRLRWLNYLRPDIKRGNITHEEEELIIRLHKLLGNRWSLIAGRIPGRTDNEIKNYWNTNLGKKVKSQSSQLPSSKKIQKKPEIETQPKIEPKVIRTKASRCTKNFITTPPQQMVDNLNRNAASDSSTGGDIETQMGTGHVLSQSTQRDDSSMNLDMGEMSLSELLSSEYFQVLHDTDGKVGEPYFLNQGLLEDWSGGDCAQMDMGLDFQSLVSILDSEEDWLGE